MGGEGVEGGRNLSCRYRIKGSREYVSRSEEKRKKKGGKEVKCLFYSSDFYFYFFFFFFFFSCFLLWKFFEFFLEMKYLVVRVKYTKYRG